MRHASIMKQLWLLTFFLIGLITVLGSFTFWRSSQIYELLDQTANQQLPAIRHMVLADMLHDGLRAVVVDSLYSGLKKDSKALANCVKEKNDKTKEFHEHIETLLKLGLSKPTVDAIENTQKELKDYTEISSVLVEAAASGDQSLAEAKFQEFNEKFEALEIKLSTLGDIIEKEANSTSSKGSNTLFTIGVLTFCGIIMGLFLSIWALRNLKSYVQNFLEEVMKSSENISSVSTRLHGANNQFSASATEAAASLQETVASLDELSSMVTLNTDSARKASDVSVQSRQSAENGERQIVELSGAMEEIKNSSKKMEEIINVIDEIAFQTNLLALNAAVEAARAGEQGRGFAVVAEAVRSLAQRSASAAKDINSMIKESISKIESGGKIVESSRNALNSIFNSVKQVSDLNQQISAASGEQSAGIKQISQAMNQLDTASQQNASGAHEVSLISNEMNAESTRLKDLIFELNAKFMGTNKVDVQKQENKTVKKNNFQSQSGAGSAKTGAGGILINLEDAAGKPQLFDSTRRRVGNLNDF